MIGSQKTFAAACCGGGFSVPSLILGDDRTQFTGAILSSRVTDDVLDHGKWIKRNDTTPTSTLKIDGAHYFSDSVQGGVSLPITTQNLGDMSLFLAHETFPEKTYSLYKPKGVTYLQVTLPSGKSIYDTTEKSEITGRGFYSVGAGIALLKSWKIWDVHFAGEFHRSFEGSHVHPGWGTSQSIGLGWNRGDWRVGSALTFLHEDPIRSDGDMNSGGNFQRNTTWIFSGSFMLTAEDALTMSYSDQTLLEAPTNTSLTKSVSLTYQHKWPR